MTSSRLTYRFGPLERRGILGPVRAGQAAILAAGVRCSRSSSLDRAPSAGGALMATVAFGVAVAVAVAPVGSRTVEEWCPIVAGVRGAEAHSPGRVPLARADAWIHGSARGAAGSLEPGVAGWRCAACGSSRPATATGRSGCSSEGGRRLTSVLACRVVSFSLLDPEAQERRLARWGLVLSGAAGTAIRRIQWIERTAPAQGDELARWLHAERDPAVPLRGTPMIESYLELIGTTARVAQEHEILLAVQVDAPPRTRARERRRAGRRRSRRPSAWPRRSAQPR